MLKRLCFPQVNYIGTSVKNQLILSIEVSFKFWAMLGPLHFYINFRVNLSVSAEKTWWDFGRYCFESTDQFGKNFHLNVESSNP